MVLFMVQLLGIVQIHIYIQQRLFLFIFGGEEAVLSKRHHAIMLTWQAMLAREMWKKTTIIRFMSFMLSFNDFDFQKVVLTDRTEPREFVAYSMDSIYEVELPPLPAFGSTPGVARVNTV